MFILFFIIIIVIEEEATGGHSCHQPLYTAGCLLCSITPTFFPHSCQDSELTELKDTIDILKAKNTEAQEIIHGALSSPDIAPQGEERAARLQHGLARTSKTSISTVQIPSSSFPPLY